MRRSCGGHIAFTEHRVDIAGSDASVFYDPTSKRLKPQFAAHVDRLRDLQVFNQVLTRQAVELGDELARRP